MPGPCKCPIAMVHAKVDLLGHCMLNFPNILGEEGRRVEGRTINLPETRKSTAGYKGSQRGTGRCQDQDQGSAADKILFCPLAW